MTGIRRFLRVCLAVAALMRVGCGVAHASTVPAGFTEIIGPGNYVVAVTGGVDDNYLVSMVDGMLTVTAPGPVAITTVEFVEDDVNYRVEASTDMSVWTEIGAATADGGGVFEFVDEDAASFTARYYRIAMP